MPGLARQQKNSHKCFQTMGETDEYLDGPSIGWYRGLYRVVWLLSDGSLNSLGHARQSFPKEVTLILACIGGGGELARFKNKKYIIRRKDKSSNSVIPLCCCSIAKPHAKSIATLCHSIDCSIPGFPVLHCLLEFAQIHVHWVSSTTEPQPPPSPPALNLSQHHGLFQWLGSFHQVAKVLELYSVYMGAYSIIGYSNLRLRMYLCKSHCVLRAKPHLCLVECLVTCCNKGGGSFITQVQPDSHFTLLFREEHMEQLRRKKCILYLECSFMTRVEYVRKCWEEMKKPRRNEVVKVLWTKDSNFITKAMVHSGGRHIDE